MSNLPVKRITCPEHIQKQKSNTVDKSEKTTLFGNKETIDNKNFIATK